MDLVEFLRARLDEDERVARDIEERTTTTRRMIQGQMVTEKIRPRSWWQAGAVWDPARVLREVEAKRLILDAHPFESGIVGGVCGTCHGAGRIEEYWDGEEETVEHVDTEMPYPCTTVRLLALPYSDHPDYREDWRP